VGWRNIVEKMHNTLTLTNWYEEKGRTNPRGKSVNLPSKVSSLSSECRSGGGRIRSDLDDRYP